MAFKHIRKASDYGDCSVYFSLNNKNILVTVRSLERGNMDINTS